MRVLVIIQLLACKRQARRLQCRSKQLRPAVPNNQGLQTQMEAGAFGNQRKFHRWSFQVSATIKPCVYNATETIGAIAFDSCNEFMATGGIARKIRVYKLSNIIEARGRGNFDRTEEEEDDDEEEEEASRSSRPKNIHDTDRSSVSIICTPSRLSSLQWCPGRAGIIACGDYDGVVTEWCVERHFPLVERDEHNGRHVWSIHYSEESPDISASASDDATVRVWQSGFERSTCTIRAANKRPYCCVEFAPSSSKVLALACADGNVYVHDLRMPDSPLWTMVHHTKAASYARFLSSDMLVSASVDSSICVWDLRNHPRIMESLTGHYNVRNFVGLSTWRQGKLVACGSETNQAHIYQVGGDGSSIWRHGFSFDAGTSTRGSGSSFSSSSSSTSSGLVSAVCWMQKPVDEPCALATANSDGILQILSGHYY